MHRHDGFSAIKRWALPGYKRPLFIHPGISNLKMILSSFGPCWNVGTMAQRQND